ncbi:MAG: hypothetical protein LBI26_01785 [Holosporales bacterium]|jgi:hypothetical protein|nr:hypothetical protein [Holosporales bacterium]
MNKCKLSVVTAIAIMLIANAESSTILSGFYIPRYAEKIEEGREQVDELNFIDGDRVIYHTVTTGTFSTGFKKDPTLIEERKSLDDRVSKKELDQILHQLGNRVAIARSQILSGANLEVETKRGEESYTSDKAGEPVFYLKECRDQKLSSKLSCSDRCALTRESGQVMRELVEQTKDTFGDIVLTQEAFSKDGEIKTLFNENEYYAIMTPETKEKLKQLTEEFEARIREDILPKYLENLKD